MLKRLCLIFVFSISAISGTAQEATRLDPLINALQLHPLLEVMYEEGVEYGNDLDRELLAGAGGEGWVKAVKEIYEPERIWKTFLPRFQAELENEDVEAMLAFFASDLGQRIIKLEVSARQALLDKSVEEVSKDRLRVMTDDGDPRLSMLMDFIEANDLIEFNVMSAMNANYAFYVGMIDGKAFDYDLTKEDVLQDVWSQESEIRVDTEEWVYAYLALSYQPLSDEELQAYIDFSNTDAGQALNRAVFAGFDDVFNIVSTALGLTAARFMKGEDL